ncbi:MAG: HAMP domain-containing histidine kinase [Elusimicrobia bacterium]|nr:HAMP domain-containing histidine kinase [Elusimicrobiota bacterium]
MMIPGAPQELKKDEMVQLVSHELRAPLNATEGYIKFLMQCESGPLNPEQMDLLNTALNNINRLEHFVTDMLDLAKMEAGRLSYRFAQADLGTLIRGVLETFRFAAAEKGVRLACDVPAGLTQARMDEGRVRQVLENLVNNALKFTDEGGTVMVSVWEYCGWLKVSVADNGAGISPEFMPELFERFSQEGARRTWNERAKGSGLGLWIVKNVVHAHGGNVWVQSERGVGSIFNFTVPASQA